MAAAQEQGSPPGARKSATRCDGRLSLSVKAPGAGPQESGEPDDEHHHQDLAQVATNACRPLILITDPSNQQAAQSSRSSDAGESHDRPGELTGQARYGDEEERYEEIDGISYRIVAAVTKPAAERPLRLGRSSSSREAPARAKPQANPMSSIRRKSSAFVTNLSNMLNPSKRDSIGADHHQQPLRRLSIYEMTKSAPPETSLEMYLSERRRSSTVSSKQVQQQIHEQQTTFETNYCQRQQYFKDLNQILINKDNKLLNVVANRGHIHRHSVDIAQLPLGLAQAKVAHMSSSRQEGEIVIDEEDPSPAGVRVVDIDQTRQRDHQSLKARNPTNAASSTISRDLLPIGEDRSLAGKLLVLILSTCSRACTRFRERYDESARETCRCIHCNRSQFSVSPKLKYFCVSNSLDSAGPIETVLVRVGSGGKRGTSTRSHISLVRASFICDKSNQRYLAIYDAT